MSDSGTSGSSAILGVIIGAIIVVAVAFFAFGGIPGMGGKQTASVNVTAPAAPSR